MKQAPEKFKPTETEVPDLATLELKANLNPEQRSHLEVLKDKMKKILGGKTKLELAKAGDLVSLNKYKTILQDILKFLETKEIKVSIIEATTPEGEKIKVDLKEELKKSENFFKEQGVDWATFPEEISLTEKQIEEFKRCVREYGFNKVMVIPSGLAGTGEDIIRLDRLMTTNYQPTKYGLDFRNPEDATLESSNNLRIILYRSQDNLEDYNLYQETRNKTGLRIWELMTAKGLDCLSAAEYLVIQRQYRLDFPGRNMYPSDSLFLFGSKPINHVKKQYMSVNWEGPKNANGLLFDGSNVEMEFGGYGAPLVKSFEIE